EPDSPQPMFNTAIRYAKAFNNKFAFKVNFAYSQAEDWRGVNYNDKNAELNSGLAINPAYDGVHTSGDDGTFNIGLLSLNPDFIQGVSAQLMASMPISQQDAMAFAQSLPAQPVARTGYREEYLVDTDAKNLKLGTSLHYRLTDAVEASYTFNYGYG